MVEVNVKIKSVVEDAGMSDVGSVDVAGIIVNLLPTLTTTALLPVPGWKFWLAGFPPESNKAGSVDGTWLNVSYAVTFMDKAGMSSRP